MWSTPEKALFARACSAAGIDPEQRHMILSGVPDNRAIFQGRPTSTSPKLTQEDFEQSMALVEQWSGGKVMLDVGRRMADGKGEQSPPGLAPLPQTSAIQHPTSHFPPGYWKRKAADQDQRLRFRVMKIDEALRLASLRVPAPLDWGEESLRGWVFKMTKGQTDNYEALGRRQLLELIEGLTAFARRHGITI